MELAIAAARAAASAFPATSSREGRTRQPRTRRPPVSTARQFPRAMGQSSRARQPLRALATPVYVDRARSAACALAKPSHVERARAASWGGPCLPRTALARIMGKPALKGLAPRTPRCVSCPERARFAARARGAREVPQGRRVGPSGGVFNTDAIRIGLALEHESCPVHKQVHAMNIYLSYFLF